MMPSCRRTIPGLVETVGSWSGRLTPSKPPLTIGIRKEDRGTHSRRHSMPPPRVRGSGRRHLLDPGRWWADGAPCGWPRPATLRGSSEFDATGRKPDGSTQPALSLPPTLSHSPCPCRSSAVAARCAECLESKAILPIRNDDEVTLLAMLHFAS